MEFQAHRAGNFAGQRAEDAEAILRSYMLYAKGRNGWRLGFVKASRESMHWSQDESWETSFIATPKQSM